MAMREFRFAWVALTLALFALGVNFFPAFQFHYEAAVTCLFVLVSVTGLAQIGKWPAGAGAARILLLLCFAHFALWYSVHVFDDSEISTAMRSHETWDAINHENPGRRIFVSHELAKVPGKLLVFVRYWPRHIFQNEWVYNEADIDEARIIWARDLGAEEDEQLRRYYSGRSVWVLEPDATPPRLTPYQPEQPAVPAPERPQHPPKAPEAAQPALRFEDVH